MHTRPDPANAQPWLPTARRRRGRTAHYTGIAAEDAAARHYIQRGASEIARRQRTPHGEIDLVVQDRNVMVFVEVKHRKRGTGWDSPVSERQWKRLECAALHYMLHNRSETGVQPVCRFDVALVDRTGQVQIIENARSCDEH